MKQTAYVLICLFIFTGLIIPSTHGYSINTGEILISYNSSFHCFIDTTNLTSNQKIALYRGLLNTGDAFFNQTGSVLTEKNNVPSEDEAPILAQQVLSQYGGLPDDAEMVNSYTSYLKEYNGSTGELIDKWPTHTSVSYTRNIDGMPVVGQTDKIFVALGENGNVLLVYKVWRTLVNEEADVPIISLNNAITKLKDGELLDPPLGIPNLTINDISTGYYEKSRTDPDIILEPVWIFSGNTSSGDPIWYYVYARHFANFTPSSTNITTFETIHFTDTSETAPVQWHWDFGDGTNSTEQNPSHLYRAAGNYSVTLKAWNDMGSDTETKEITVTFTKPLNADFNATVENCNVRMNWDVITDSRLQGYKVVISKDNPNPQYPDDGYMFWITDRYRNYSVITSTDLYNGGDFGGYLQPGQSYYFSITAVYSDAKVAGNAVELEFPYCGTPTPTATTPTITPTTTCTQNPCEPYTAPLLNGTAENNRIQLDWDVITNPCLQGYKVVISKNNPEPKYPDDGYMFWITDRNTHTSAITTTDHYNGGDFGGYLQPGQEYYFSITAVYPNAKVPGNVIRLVYPPDATPTPTPIQETIHAEVRIEPEMLNLNSNGEFTAFITLLSGYDVHDINTASLMCEGARATDGHATGEGSDMFIAKFNRQDLVGVPTGDKVTFTVNGTMVSDAIETRFSGSDTIRVTNNENGKNK